ncbi:hypothetical protein ACH4SK_17450 [Streptomyces inhibens]|uniref:hypothetical protein n=1 Tax=Streptomyces inhibens TaxID=2293571 RepID=UPI0037B95711
MLGRVGEVAAGVFNTLVPDPGGRRAGFTLSPSARDATPPRPPAPANASHADDEALRRRQIPIPHTVPEKRDQAGHRLRRGSTGGLPPGFDREMYKRSHRVECLTSLLKQTRGIATRYEKPAVRSEATTVQLALIRQALCPHLKHVLD